MLEMCGKYILLWMANLFFVSQDLTMDGFNPSAQ